MIVKFYGTRGSIPVCDSNFQEFGGNTTCVMVHGGPNEDYLIFDAGTGIRNLGKDLMKVDFAPGQKIHMAFSHFHWDHIQGFPFFAPAYDPDKRINVILVGENINVSDLKDIFAYQMQQTYFPVHIDDMGAQFTYGVSDKKVAEFEDGSGRMITNVHSHPGGARGYRLEYKGKVVVYCTDVEHGDQIDQNVVELARNADILIHEAQYTPEELPKFKGWGHSSWKQAIEVAKLANVKSLYLTHHDPEHNDDFLRAVEAECQEYFPKCFLARDGMEVDLDLV